MDVPHIIAGRFRIECEIGTGGMGTVYRATHLGLERAVAVKIIKPEYAADPDVADRFMREARTMAKLRHSHAAMIFDAGNLPDGRHFIVMEFVEGCTLSETLVQEGRFSPERAVRIASDICDVLSEAHKLGIVHRDLKPSNIMLNDRGVCVLDFGVAKVLASSAEATASHATTGSGIIVGTPRYMSPEQCLGQRVGVRSDLYSLGVILYEMLAGRPPFTDAMASVVLVKQATAQPPLLPKVREDVPRPLCAVIHSLLAKQPEDRPANAATARSLLEKSITQPARQVPEAEPFASTVATQETRARSTAFRIAASCAVISALGLLLFAVGRDAGSTGSPKTATASAARNALGTEKVTSRDSASYTAGEAITVPQRAPSATPETRRTADALSQGEVSAVRLVRAGRGSLIAAIHDERRSGTTHLFVMERMGASFRVMGRAPLDAADFRSATWSADSLDADNDGYEEVVCTGANPRGSAKGYRLVLFVPRTRETYTLRLLADTTRGSKILRSIWSPNALTRKGAAYRAALQQRARSLTASL
ncbi:MAG TPA: serine/threonine-protein kinase [Pyrinomonadaceae bacterium]|nr:serine/threonine-protein kinase [Pyrinomonadaceae bacterium]